MTTLRRWSAQWMFPPGTTRRPGRTSEGYGRGLAELIEGKRQLPTPQKSDYKGPNNSGSGSKSANGLATLAGGQLNPPWVEWLMGWPVGWTDLAPLEMDKCHYVHPSPGRCFTEWLAMMYDSLETSLKRVSNENK
jgi:hypothetical protein